MISVMELADRAHELVAEAMHTAKDRETRDAMREALVAIERLRTPLERIANAIAVEIDDLAEKVAYSREPNPAFIVQTLHQISAKARAE